VLLDIRLDTEWGLDLIPWLKSRTKGPRPAVAVYSCFSDSAHVSAALALGVKAYIIKKRDETELEAALETVLAGGEWIDSEACLPSKASGGPLAALTKREAQILSLIKAGFSFREIARRLGIKLHTVQNTASCIKDKLYISSFMEIKTR
jgi:DNA-binding NarL/FixJ family response regulator